MCCMTRDRAKPLIVIIGETASGKSALALEIAKQFDGELICADSWTVRRELNIGTAKPSADELALVPHHLLNIVDPDEDFTAAVFKRLANQAIADIVARGKLPIMVGGTGLYIDGVLYDYGFLEAGDREQRKRFDSMSISDVLKEIHVQAIELGDVDIRNKRRLIRLLETNGAQPTRAQLRPNTLLIGLQPERSELEQLIVKRVDIMLKAGLEGEVRQLVAGYGWQAEGLKGVGYAQWRGYFDSTESLAETRQKIIKATLDLAKRQRTWFRRNKSIHWFSTPVNLTDVVDLITTYLSKQQ